MEQSEISSDHRTVGSWRRIDTLTACLLFIATAAVVIWQNLRLGVLWDLSYILENSHRISLGDIPYRDFPFPYAPLTFLIQAAIIKLTGRVFFHHIIYSAAAGGAGTLVAWRVLGNVLRGTVQNPRLISFLLSAPLIVLGIYCVYPHPFYDSDCTLVILTGILLLQRLDYHGTSPLRAFCCGAVLIVPLFVKQNTGLGFLASAGLGIALLMAIELWRGRSIKQYLWIGAGAATAFATAVILIHEFAGLGNYWHWTIQFAAQRRAPDLNDMFEPFRNFDLVWWFAAVVSGAILAMVVSGRRRSELEAGRSGGSPPTLVLEFFAVALISVPFLWGVIYLFVDDDPSSRAERLLALWPFILTAALLAAVFRTPRQSGMRLVLPFILIGTIQGAFLSQQLWGSTYAIWPLLMMLIAILVVELSSSSGKMAWAAIPIACVVTVTLIISGGFYVWSHERLDYANVRDGAITRSTMPALAGLSMRGNWIPQFEELVRFADKNIPRNDGLLMIPGEDLFYYGTGRHPGLPVVMFDHTVNPYSPEQVVELSTKHNIRWLVVKRVLQLQEQPYADQGRLLELLGTDFHLVARLENYDVYAHN